MPSEQGQAHAARATGLELVVDDDGLARLEFDLPDSKVNKLTADVVRALDVALAALEGHERARGVILLSRKESSWIAGADIEEIRRLSTAEEARQMATMGQRVLTRLARLPIPSVAAIDGSCLGGGLELALACTLRVAADSPRTLLGLPEIRLGIVPGFGGTQRLPRLVGLPAAADLILSGRSLSARRAEQIGLVDRACPPEYLLSQARALLNEVLERGLRGVRARRAARRGRGVWLLEFPPLRRLWFTWVRRLTERKSGGHYPAPLAALKAIEAAARTSIDRGLELEARLIGEMAVTDVSRNLISLFFLAQAIKRDTGVEGDGTRPRSISAAGVLGAGAMGGGIAEALAESGIDVRMKDVDASALARGMGAAASVLRERVRRRRLEPREAERAMARIAATLDWRGFRRCGLLVEAVIEDLDLKKKVLQEAEAALPEGAILVSNTSSLSIDAMASSLRDPARMAGWHFFNPVDRMPLVEVVQGAGTAPEVVVTLVALTKKLGKTPIVVRDRPGFLVNRLLMIYMMEAVRMIEEGAGLDRLDAALRRFGMPMGPVMLFDQVGLDVAVKVAEVLGAAFPSQELSPGLLKRMVEAGRKGKKNGLGFYIHPERGPARIDPHVYALIGTDGRLQVEAEEIQDRLLLPMINEACRILEEKVVRGPNDVDAGMIYGAGFPPFRGGLLRWADALGARTVAERLLRLAEKLGARFKPCDPLMERATRGERFHLRR
jgi:3-hydroxyacyl-CoA dehydrogenase/enoyl-CoA hydratase/3-hydroxybutyryl-CoA epimerase